MSAMYNEIFLLIKTCIEFWKGFFNSDNKKEYFTNKNGLIPILMLILGILIALAFIYTVTKLLCGSSEATSKVPTSPVVTEKTQTFSLDGKDIVCNVRVEIKIPKN